MTYTNPIITFSSAADPTVIRTEEGFYLYATQTNAYWIPIYFSKDLVNWEFKEVLSEMQPNLNQMYFPVEVHFEHRKFATSMESMCFIFHGQNGGWKYQLYGGCYLR
ncbi:family 43 glycosylhydrolase [Bacteroides sp. CR5/BHMF/2]|nr:family 43 glycosylhydrolase [Bacteroides sp. CR5/BHMF/2]